MSRFSIGAIFVVILLAYRVKSFYAASSVLDDGSHHADSDESIDGILYCQQPENFTHDLCQPFVGRTNTYLPNILGHTSQLEAALALSKFFPFFQIDCSAPQYLRAFLCYVHFPLCVPSLASPILPCREVCHRVRDECSGAFEAAGARWPDSLNCTRFLSARDQFSLCLEFNDDESGRSEGTEAPTLNTASPPPPTDGPDPHERCEALLHADDLCTTLGYNTTFFPNMVGHRNQSDALLELHKYSVFMNVDDTEDGCTDSLRVFLCLVYLPPCKVAGDVAVPIPPCEALCQVAMTEACRATMTAFRMELPAALSDCSHYPKEMTGSHPTCLSPGARLEPLLDWARPPTARCADSAGCVFVTHPRCLELGFEAAWFPNAFLGHQTVEEATAELDRIVPLFYSGCSDEIQSFLCSAFFVDRHRRPPCRESCLRVWKSCRRQSGSPLERRPRAMTCRVYPPEENCTIPAQDPCEPLRLTLCAPVSRGGRTRLPNLLGHTSQYQAELESHQFLPLLLTNCSSDLLRLICAFYAPECQTSPETGVRPSAPLCREFCNNVKSACAEAAALIGFEWPRGVRCDLLEPAGSSESTSEVCVKAPVGPKKKDCIKLRRYDITDRGIQYLFYGWADVQEQGAANDYCRVVSIEPYKYKMLSCALAGTQGEGQYNYNSSDPDSWLDLGHADTWYMRDEDGDGRDDYCRCVGAPPDTYTSCLRAGEHHFEQEFIPEGASNDCQYIRVNRFFGP